MSLLHEKPFIASGRAALDSSLLVVSPGDEISQNYNGMDNGGKTRQGSHWEPLEISALLERPEMFDLDRC